MEVSITQSATNEGLIMSIEVPKGVSLLTQGGIYGQKVALHRLTREHLEELHRSIGEYLIDTNE